VPKSDIGERVMEGFCSVMNCTKGEPHINNYIHCDEVSDNPCSAVLNILFTKLPLRNYLTLSVFYY